MNRISSGWRKTHINKAYRIEAKKNFFKEMNTQKILLFLYAVLEQTFEMATYIVYVEKERGKNRNDGDLYVYF